MSARVTLGRVARFLTALAAIVFVATILELLMAEHYDSPMQLVPCALCGLGLLALGALEVRRSRGLVLATRALMAIIAAGSLLGVWEHIEGNLAFVREVRLHADTTTLVTETLRGGAPVLAPGMLALGAVLAIAATVVAEAAAGDPVPIRPRAIDAPATGSAHASPWLHERFPHRDRTTGHP